MMRLAAGALLAGAHAEALRLRRSPLLLALVLTQAVTFLLLVSLFGLTGSRAPTALVQRDRGVYARRLVHDLETAHHSFALQPMTLVRAQALLAQGDLVAAIVIPPGFSRNVAHGRTVPLPVVIDNVDADLTDDIQRAVPSAIVAFADQSRLPGIHVRPAERDLLPHDTGFIPYLVVSALALDAFVVACLLAGVAVAREFETGAVVVLGAAPISPLVPIAGRLLITAAISFLAVLLTAGVVVLGYGVAPLHPVEALGALLLSVLIFTCIGAALGAALRRTLPIAPLAFGLALPLYIDSGSLEPERFDGNTIWLIAHLSPMYYAVGIVEDAFHGLRVTPEPIWGDVLGLCVWAFLAAALAAFVTMRSVRA